MSGVTDRLSRYWYVCVCVCMCVDIMNVCGSALMQTSETGRHRGVEE